MLVLAAALVGVTLAAVAAEVAVRLLFGPQPRFPSRVVEAPWGLRMNEPGAVYRQQSADVRVEIRIDADGFRADRDHPRAKPGGVRRIVALGDAFTLGAAVEREQTFSHVLESELRKAGLAVDVLNAGVPGFGTAEECLYLERALFDYAPDLVLVSFRAEDLEENERADLLRFDGRKLVAGRDSYVPALLRTVRSATSWPSTPTPGRCCASGSRAARPGATRPRSSHRAASRARSWIASTATAAVAAFRWCS